MGVTARRVRAKNIKSGIYGLFTVLALLYASAGAQELPRVQEPSRFEAGAALLYGSINGSLQTPNGGKLITSDNDRPTLDELGIEHATMTDFWMNVRRPDDGLYFGGRLIRLDGSSTLETDLLTRGETLPAGSPVESDVKLDWYRFGYGRRYLWRCEDKTIEFFPSIGVALFTFEYQLSSPVAIPIDRGYAKGGVQIGLGVTAPLTERLSLVGQAFLPIALSNAPNILSLQLAGKYQFLNRKDLSLSGLLGVGYDRIYYVDNQLLPNEIRVDVGPMLVAGLEATF
jgi:hypothetical protein